MMTREGWHRCLSWWCLFWLLRHELVLAMPMAMTTPVVHPEIMTLEQLPTSVQPSGAISMWRNAPFLLNFQTALPAAPGSMFDGPDPGRSAAGNPIITSHQLLVYVLDDQGPNPNIINIPESSCPSGYRRDTGGVCRIILGPYGPNPFHSFQPENFKGDLQFYMGLKVGRPSRPSRPFRRRPRLRGRPRRPGAIGGSAKLSPAVRGRARAPVEANNQPTEVQPIQNQDKNNGKNNDDDDDD